MSLYDYSLADDNALWDLCFSRYQLAAVTVADEIGFFVALHNKKLTIEELSHQLAISARAVQALAGVLSHLGLIDKNDALLNLNQQSKNYLLPSSLFYWGKTLQTLRERNDHKILSEAVMTSKNLLTHSGQSYSDMWKQGTLTKEAARNFTDKMHESIFAPALKVMKSGIFDSINCLLDVGGGAGSFDIAFIDRYPNKKAVVFDLLPVCEVAQEYISKFNYEKQIKTYAGNFFEDPWPKACDGILFSQIFHDWSPLICKELATRAYQNLEPGGTVFIHEMLLNQNKDAPFATVFFDLLMFINHGSQQFTIQELFDLLIGVGFKDPKVIQTFGYFSIVFAYKPNS